MLHWFNYNAIKTVLSTKYWIKSALLLFLFNHKGTLVWNTEGMTDLLLTTKHRSYYNFLDNSAGVH